MTNVNEAGHARILALHLSTAIAAHRRQLRRDAVPCPPGLAELEVLLLDVARNGGQMRPEFAPAARGFDNFRMDDRLLLTYEEAGKLLGLAERSVRRLVADGKLLAVDTGRGSSRIRRADLEAYVATLGPKSFREGITVKTTPSAAGPRQVAGSARAGVEGGDVA